MSGSVSCFCCQLIVDNSCNFTIGDSSHDRPVSAMKNSQQVETFPGQSLTLMEIYEDCMGALIIHSHPDLIFKICNISWNCDCPKRHRILLKLWHKYFFSVLTSIELLTDSTATYYPITWSEPFWFWKRNAHTPSVQASIFKKNELKMTCGDILQCSKSKSKGKILNRDRAITDLTKD